MHRFARILGLAAITLTILGCNARTDKTNGGGIVLSISRFDQWPTLISASDSYETIGTIDVQSIVKNSSQPTSSLMRVEIQSYEVTFTREDSGSRVPPRLVEYLSGSIDPGGTYTLTNGPFMRLDQFNNQPLKDLREKGIDPETGSTVIRLRVGIRFFGHTIAGDPVETNTGYFSLEVTP